MIAFYSSKRGFTLVEILVAMAIFILLGLMLAKILNRIQQVWELTENQRMLQDSARIIFSFLEEDFHSVYWPNKNLGTDIWFSADYDTQKRQRIRFIRKFQEKEYPQLLAAGALPASEGYDQYFYGMPNNNKLRASDALAEVVYCSLPVPGSQKLYRGFRTPIGGNTSFGITRNLENIDFPRHTHCLAENILFFGIQGWTGKTSTWKPGSTGPIYTWDSSQSMDNLPFKIQIHIALTAPHIPQGNLADELLPHQDVLMLQDMSNFPPPDIYHNLVKINDEWIQYSMAEKYRLTGLKRGMFGTNPQKHSSDTIVYWGNWYARVFALPQIHVPWK